MKQKALLEFASHWAKTRSKVKTEFNHILIAKC